MPTAGDMLEFGRMPLRGGGPVPSQDLAVVVLTQRAADETGMPAVLAAASALG